MTTFDERERGYEAKFAHDAEMSFRAEARRNRLFGLWAAEMLGKKGAEAEDYAAAVVRSDIAEHGADDVVRRVTADLAGRADPDTVRARHAALLATARAQILAEA